MAQALGETFMKAILADFPSLRAEGSGDARGISKGSSSTLGKHVRENEDLDKDMSNKRCRKGYL